jgi:hypothetical protein
MRDAQAHHASLRLGGNRRLSLIASFRPTQR